MNMTAPIERNKMSNRMKLGCAGCIACACTIFAVTRHSLEARSLRKLEEADAALEHYFKLYDKYQILCIEAELFAQVLWESSGCTSQRNDEETATIAELYMQFAVTAMTAHLQRSLNAVAKLTPMKEHIIEFPDPENVLREVGSRLERFGIDPYKLRERAQREFQAQ